MENLIRVVFVILLAAAAAAAATTPGFKHETVHFPEFVKGKSEELFIFDGEGTSIENGALQLTPDSTNDMFLDIHHNKSGRIMYYQPFRIHDGNKMGSFNSSFVINLFRNKVWVPGHGLTFLISPNTTLPESSYGQYLGLTNDSTDGHEENQIFAIEFDTVKQEFDPDNNHVGLNINSVRSKKSVSLKNMTLSPDEGTSYKVWVEYSGVTNLIQVYMVLFIDTFEPIKPQEPILDETIDLKEYLKEESYFGFSASTGNPQIQLNCVRRWTLEIEVLPKKKDWKVVIIVAGVCVPLVMILLVLGIILYVNRRRRIAEQEHHEFGKLKWLPGMPRQFKYKELKKATKNFHESLKLGEGGFGVVYKGILHDKDHTDQNSITEIAVKKFTRDNIKSKDDFYAELAIIHRLRHKHLVRLVGWCYEKGKLLLVYEFMPNGSVDSHLYGNSETTLSWSHRYKILTGVASGLYYLHNEYDQKVVHRDLKASNILLDLDFNARLGDFGLARAIEDERNSYAELVLDGVPGTKGYVAPECFHTGKATPESDAYGFGAVILEVVCGRSPGAMISIEQHSCTLIDWVWMFHREGRIQDAVHERLKGEFDVDEAKRLLLLGLACSHPIAEERPKTEEILQIITGILPAPVVPPFKPVFTWPSTGPCISIDSLLSSNTFCSDDFGTTSSVSRTQRVSAPLLV